MNFKSRIRSRIWKSLLKRGYTVSHADADDLGVDPFLDMIRLTQTGVPPTVFDIGANFGQTVDKFRACFPSAVIHSFEPGEDTFATLQRNTAGIHDLHLNNVALGARCERRLFIENESADMSSFLEPDRDSWGAVSARREVALDTVDAYCARNSINRIDILKSDTQGFDLEVFRGAEQMFRQHRIHLVYTEIIFSRMYKDLPRLDQIYGFLSDHGLSLVSFYAMHYQNNRAGWTDALFVDPEYR